MAILTKEHNFIFWYFHNSIFAVMSINAFIVNPLITELIFFVSSLFR